LTLQTPVSYKDVTLTLFLLHLAWFRTRFQQNNWPTSSLF